MTEEYEGEVQYLHPEEKKENKLKRLHTDRMILLNRIRYLNEQAHFESTIDRYFEITKAETEKRYIECQIQIELSATYLTACPF